MKILIIGASSYVGARIYYDLEERYEIIGTYSSNKLSSKFIQLDITNHNAVKNIITQIRPEIIIHVANNANSRWCDANPKQAISLNQTATRYIVKEANKINSSVIYISTIAAVNPTSLYGKTKFESEKIINKTKKNYLILRPSLILGYSPNTTNDRPFNRILANFDLNKPAIYDTSWKFQPTYLHHISEIIDGCIQKSIWNRVIQIMVPELKSRFDVARDILSAFGIEVTPVDHHDNTPTFQQDLSILKDLRLPQYSYQQMVKEIIAEIKNRNIYHL